MNHDILRKEVLEFLKRHYIMEIATCLESRPAVSIMLYAVDDEFHFFFATHRDSVKSQNLLKNPNISLSVWKANEKMVQVSGQAKEVTDKKRKDEIVDALANSATMDENFWPPVFRISGDGYIVFEVTITWLRTLDLSRNTITQEESPFTEIELI